ncbi:hypothetical protein MASR2M29_01580 [Spirochaetota bacterium]
MKRIFWIAFFVALAAAAYAASGPVFGFVDYAEGSATFVRSGRNMGELNIGDEILPDDMIKTANDGLVIINLDKSTGMRGSLTIKSKSVAYIRLTPDATSPKTTIELISGQIGSKLNKIAGSPSLQVQSDSISMGVRGTEFTMAMTVNESVLVICTDGVVSCNDGTDSLDIAAGRAAEKQAGQKLKVIPVAISSAAQFEKRWFADEIEAFRGNALRALADYEKRYNEQFARFDKAFTPLQKSEVLSKWIREDTAGLVPRSNDPAVLNEKKAIMKDILETRKVLFIFERLYYRILEIEGIIAGTALEKALIKPGLSAGDFLKKVKADAPGLEKRVFLFRYAEKLYEQRNQGGAGLPGMGLGDDDFFGSSDDWDF